METYQYSASATTNGVFAPDSLHAAIAASAIADAALVGVVVHGEGGAGIAHIAFTQALSPESEAILDAIIAAHDGVPIPQPAREFSLAGVTVKDGLLSIANNKTTADNDPMSSHNFCDPTTWWQGAVAFDVTATRTLVVLQPVYRIPNGSGGYRTNLIDIEHGKVSSLEDRLDAKYRLEVKVNGVLKTVKSPLNPSGDYTCDYEAGTIIFDADPGVGATVTAKGYYAVSSAFLFYAPPGKIWKIDAVEVQFSKSARLQVPVFFETLLYNRDSNGIPTTPLDLGAGPIHAVSPRVYKNKWTMILEANRFYMIPFVVGDEDAGFTEDLHVHGWEYKGVKPLSNLVTIPGVGTFAVVLKLSTMGDVPLLGSRAAVTLYTITDDAT